MIADVNDKIIRLKEIGPFQVALEGGQRLAVDFRIGGGKIDQIGGVDNDRPDMAAAAELFQLGGVF